MKQAVAKNLAQLAIADLVNAFLDSADWPAWEGPGNLADLELSESESKKIRKAAEKIASDLYKKCSATLIFGQYGGVEIKSR